MGLVLRQQLNITNGPGLVVKNAELSYAEGDSNFLYLLTNMSGSNITITGPTSITGNVTITGVNHTVTGLITGTITNALNATTASYILSSGVSGPHGMNSILSASYAISASYAPNAGGVEGGTTNYIPLWASATTLTISNIYQTPSTNFIGINTIVPTHNLEVKGTVAFPDLITTSPLTDVVMWDSNTGRLYYTASTAIAGTFAPGGTNSQIQFNNNGVFGGVPTLTYTGSLLRATGSFTGSFSGSLFGTASWAISSSRAITASYALTASFVATASHALTASRAISSSYSTNALSASYADYALNSGTASFAYNSYGAILAENALTASIAESASYALTASFVATASHALTASYAQVNLQQVTTVGSSSTDTIFVGGAVIRSGSTVVTTLDYTGGGGGRITLKESNGSSIVNITTPSLSTNRNIEIPDGNGFLPLTVNGYPANSAGAIVIPTTAGNISGSGDPGYISYWSGSTDTLGTSMIYYDDINEYIGIGTNTPSGALSVSGTVYFYDLIEQTQVNFVTYDSASGQLHYFSTASWAYSASQAVSSSYTQFALTASYASSSTSASYASSSTSASYASSSTSASYASSSTSASYASSSTSASYASSSTSASYSSTASYVVEALTASYVNPLNQDVIITGSLTLSGSGITINIPSAQTNYVLTSDSNGNATWQPAGAVFPYTGSAIISGSLGVTGSISILSGSMLGTASWATSSITSSYPVAVTGSTIYSTGPLSISNPNPAGNIFFGSGSGVTVVTESVFLGKQTGQNAVSASNSILIGTRAGLTSTTAETIGTNNIIIGTNITLATGRKDSINIGGLIFGTGSYSTPTGNPSPNSAGGRVGINVVTPIRNFEVSGTIAFPSLGTTSNVTNVIMWSGSTGQLFVTASSALRPDSASYASTASYADFAFSASYASSSTSASFASTASYVAAAASVPNSLSNSTGISNFTYNGSQPNVLVSVSGALQLTANKIVKWTGAAFANTGLHDENNLVTGSVSIQLTGASSILTGSFTGSLTGSLFGTASWAHSSSQALTASYITGSIFSGSNLALSASYALTASFVSSLPVTIKAGSASAASFGGTPLTSSTITFGTSFPNNLYAITVTGEDARSWTIKNKVSSSFTINSNSVEKLTGPVYWVAVPYNS
jgi:hypothetical protein